MREKGWRLSINGLLFDSRADGGGGAPVTPTFTSSGSGPYFRDPSNIPNSTTGLTFRCIFVMPSLPPTGTWNIAIHNSGGFNVEVQTGGSLRVNITDSAVVKVLNNYSTTLTLVPGVLYDIVASADFVTNQLTIVANGGPPEVKAFTTTSSGFVLGGRKVSFLGTLSGSNQLVATVTYLAVWEIGSPSGAVPGTTPRKVIQGNAATVNADPWKLGADAT